MALLLVFILIPAINGLDLVPTEILQQFPEYNTIFYFDNGTRDKLDLFPYQSPLYVVNYNEEEKIIQRSYTLPFLIVVHLSDLTRFSDVRLLANDVIVFFLSAPILNFLDGIFKVKDLYKVGGLFVYDFSTRILYNCCFYCGTQSGVLNVVSEGEKVPDLTNYVDQFWNFHQHTFQIGYTDYPPFFDCKFVDGECDPQGSEGQLLKTLSKYLNFRYEMFKINDSAENGDWYYINLALKRRRIQWAVGGISISLKRSREIDFTRFIHTESFKVLFTRHIDRWAAITHVVLAFKWPIYLFGGISIGFLALFGKFSTILTKSSEKSTFFGYVNAALSSLIEQATSSFLNSHTRNYSLKIVFLIWWLLSLCLTTLYKSQLASFLIKPRTYEPTRIEELVENGYTFHANMESWAVLKENFEETTIPVYKEVLKLIDDRLVVCEAILQGLQKKVGIVDEETPLRHKFYTYCSQNMTAKQMGEFVLLEENLFPGGYHAWTLQLSLPFRKTFSHAIGMFFDSGLISHWYNSELERKYKTKNNKDNTFNALSIMRVMGPFAVLFIGLIIAFGIFLLELLNFTNKF